MIIKGHSSTGRGLGAYLEQDKNDRAEVLDIRGDIPRDLSETLDDWRSATLGTNCTKPLYHAQINPDRVLSPEEWNKAVEIFEQEMGFENQPRAMVLHEYKGREHMHLVYSRIDEDGKAISDSWNYLHHEKAAREIERELGLEHTQGAFIGREGPRPDRTPDHAEIQQGERLNLDPKEIKAEISEIYQSAENGRAFVEALEAEGYTLAQGDKRGYVILDQAGGVHSLSRMAGVKVGELRETLEDYPLRDLPTVEQAREQQQERQQEAAQAHAPEIVQAPPLAAPELASREPAHEAEPQAHAPQIDRADDQERDEERRAAHLAATLYDRGGMVAMQRDAMRDHQHRQRDDDEPRPQHPDDHAPRTMTAAERLQEALAFYERRDDSDREPEREHSATRAQREERSEERDTGREVGDRAQERTDTGREVTDGARVKTAAERLRETLDFLERGGNEGLDMSEGRTRGGWGE